MHPTDILTAEAVRRYLPAPWPSPITVADSLPSTNDALKQIARDAPEGTVLLARRQTAGRGRSGRSFFSPEETGLYLSLCLRPCMPPEMAVRITAAAAVAAAEAIEQVCGLTVGIKWVNDLYLNGKKVAGILAEAVFTEMGKMDFAVLGIGINLAHPTSGFPPEIADIATALLPAPLPDGRARLAAAFLTAFMRLYGEITAPTPPFLADYAARCFFLGETVEVITARDTYFAKAVGINEDLSLAVRRADGKTVHLHTGEIRIRLANGVESL